MSRMPYLVDGHNLIPKLGLRLDSPDDETELIGILQEFARLSRRDLHVYFDAAPAGHAQTRRLGRVTAHFIRVGSTADNAIKSALHRLGAAARNWIVISSDRVVQNEARALHARVISSDEFAKQLRRVQQKSQQPVGERQITTDEVQEWLRLFGGKE
jgi:predicted RNA-binding protein with PIN domain